MNFTSKIVLVIDDDLQVRRQLREVVETEIKAKYREAEHPGIAQTLFKKFIPDLVILDTHLPVMDGLSMLNYLRSDVRFRDTRIIMSSEAADEILLNLAQERGINGFLLKPFTSDVAKKKIISVLSATS